MLRYLHGRIAGTFDGGVICDVNSIGYEVNVPDASVFFARVGEETDVFVAMLVREDDVSLYGFASQAELRMFRLLMTVNGIGAKASMAILSALSIPEICAAIRKDDAGAFTRANGVGKKTAQRIAMELKDKLESIPEFAPYIYGGTVEVKTPAPETNPTIEKAIGALTGLGLAKQEAEEAAKAAYEEGITAEDLILKALRAAR